MNHDIFIEVSHFNRFKTKKCCSGDVFLSERSADGQDVIVILTDGLGSGQQANVAASLTATMAMEYMKADIDLRRAAEMIMDALPICPDRHISYSTFTMIHARATGTVKIIEYENPLAVLFRGESPIPIQRTIFTLPRWDGRKMTYATFTMQCDDRLFFCSDGITQAGLGSAGYPFGWGMEKVLPFVQTKLATQPPPTTSLLCKKIVDAATALDGGYAGDDTTACLLHYREPRILQILTGPPFQKDKDYDFANLVNQAGIKSIISGGSTANLVSRELHRDIDTPLIGLDPTVPAESIMQGVDLVTEGCITLSKVIDLLEDNTSTIRINAATKMRDLLLDSDKIYIAVGTAINPAHQDPNLPVALDIRRNIIKRLANILQRKHLKELFITYY